MKAKALFTFSADDDVAHPAVAYVESLGFAFTEKEVQSREFAVFFEKNKPTVLTIGFDTAGQIFNFGMFIGKAFPEMDFPKE